MPRIPTLTHLQFAALSELIPGEISGADHREVLRARYRIRKSLPAYYQLMSRLEDAGFVKGFYRVEAVGEHTARTRWYRILGTGVRAINETRSFYAEAVAVRGRAGGKEALG